MPSSRAVPRSATWVAAAFACALMGVALGQRATGYPLPIVFSLAIMFYALAAPHAALYTLLAAMPFSFRFFLPNKSELQVPSEPVVAAFVGAYVFDRAIALVRGKEVEPHPFRWPLIVYGAVMFLAVAQSDFLFISGKNAVRSVAYVWFAFPAFALLQRPKALRAALKALLLGGVAATLIMVFLLSQRIGELTHSSAYEDTLFSDYSGYGAFVAVFILALVALSVFDPASPRRATRWALLAFFGVAMVFCLSRGAWISLFAGLAFLLAQRSPIGSRQKWAIVGVGIAAVAVVTLIPGVRAVAVGRLSTILDPSFASNRTRLLRWGFALVMFARNPILGAGPGVFAQTYVNESFLGADVAQYKLGAHSAYLQTLAETGALGFLAFAWLAVAFYVYGFRLLRRLRDSGWNAIVAGAMAVQTSFLVHFIVGNLLTRDIFSVPFWGMFGLLPAVAKITGTDMRRTALTTDQTP